MLSRSAIGSEPTASSAATSLVVRPSGKRSSSGSADSGGAPQHGIEVGEQHVVGEDRLPAARHEPATVLLEHERRRREADRPSDVEVLPCASAAVPAAALPRHDRARMPP